MKYRSMNVFAGLLSIISTSQAENLREDSGWLLELNLNMGYSYQQSQFNTGDDNEITANLTNSGKSTSSFFVLPLYRVEYTFGNLNTQFYLGNTGDNVSRGNMMDELGFVQSLGETVFTLAYGFADGGANEVWEDPYLTGKKRTTTDQTTHGGRIRADYIVGLPLSLEYGFTTTEVDDEKSGQNLFSSGRLSEQQRLLLRRDNDSQWVILEAPLPIDEELVFIPGFFYTEVEADGISNSYDKYGANLTVFAGSDDESISANISYEQSDHDGNNPVFNKIQKDETFSFFLSYGYDRPFGWENAAFTLFTGWNNTRSNITFFESKGGFAAAGLSYRF